MISTYCLLITAGPGVTKYNASKKNVHGKFCILTLKSKYLETRSPSLGALNYPIFLSRRFHRPTYFQFEFISNSDPHRNLGDQQTILVFSVLDWNKLAMEAHAGEYHLHLKRLPASLTCKLVPVQYWEYEYGLLQSQAQTNVGMPI